LAFVCNTHETEQVYKASLDLRSTLISDYPTNMNMRLVELSTIYMTYFPYDS